MRKFLLTASLALCTLPSYANLTFKSFTASTAASGIGLSWEVSTDEPKSTYSLERSADGIIFQEIYALENEAHTEAGGFFTYTDPNPLPGMDYYRIRHVNGKGTWFYSMVIAVKFVPAAKKELSLYPNPSAGASVMLNLSGFEPGTVSLTITDLSGRSCYVTRIPVDGLGTGSLTLDPRSFLLPGIYLVQVETEGRILKQKLVLN